MVVRKSVGEKIFGFFNAIILTFICLCTLYPFLYVIFASISNPAQFISYRGILWHPLGFQWDSYKMVLSNQMIGSGYANTLFIVVVGTVLNVFFTALGAYALSRQGYYWRKVFSLLLVFTMMFSGGLIPTYLTVNSLKLIDSLWALILPGLISTYNLMIMRTSFANVPASLEESAKLDGANDWTVLFRIFFPLSKAVIAVMLLYYGVAHWNGWFNAMLYLRSRTKYPLQIVLREILIANDTSSMTTDVSANDQEMVAETIKYACIVVSTIPIMCVYPFVQKYFVTGVMIGSMKG
ncbi:MAG: carbohydrate ABC transporter permease [Christensenellales bacterium]|jgi:putative aldouronate transport system permease protein